VSGDMQVVGKLEFVEIEKKLNNQEAFLPLLLVFLSIFLSRALFIPHRFSIIYLFSIFPLQLAL
jgi:hypothetical protein